MAILPNARHEKYVQYLIQGMSQRKAYREAFKNAENWKDSTVDNRASELYNTREILGRYKELLEESRDKAIMNRKDRMVVLSELASNKEEKPDARIRAIDTLNKMDGEYVNRVEVSSGLKNEQTKLDDLIKQIHGGDGE